MVYCYRSLSSGIDIFLVFKKSFGFLTVNKSTENKYHFATEIIFLAISVAIFYLHSRESALQNAVIELYYVPIVIAAVIFGWRWGLFYGILASIMSLVVLHGIPSNVNDWLQWLSLLISFRIGLFLFIGACAGYVTHREKQQEEGYKKLSDAINAIQNPTSPQEEQKGLEQILDAAETLLKPKSVDRISIMLVDMNRKFLRIVAARGIPVEILRSTRQPVTKGIAGYVIQSKKPLLCKDYGELPEKIQLIDSERGITSSICVPINSGNKVVGVMSASTHSKAQPFDDKDLSAFVILAHAAAATIQNSPLFKGLKNAYLPTIQALSRAIHAKDQYTYNHSEKIAEYAMAVADCFTLTDSDKADLYAAALLHDIGKIGIRDSVLFKNGKLTPEEYEEIKKHSMLGVKILEPLEDLKGVSKIVMHHQEKFDGTGYPYGLKGDEIPLGARILAVVDAYNAMTTDRVYRKAMTSSEAREEMERYKGKQFDPEVVEAFNQIYDFGWIPV